MRLSVEFDKNTDGNISVCIKVIDQQSYPTRDIFKGANDYPVDEHYKLEYGNTDEIRRYLPSSEVEEWVNKQIKTLKNLLDAWRQIQVPEDYEVEI